MRYATIEARMGEQRDDDQRVLSRARAAVACGRFDTAIRLLAELAQRDDPAIAPRAKLQLALANHLKGNRSKGIELLSEVGCMIDVRRIMYRDQLLAASGADVTLESAIKTHREVQMELARTWYRVDEYERARNTYGALLREAGIGDARTHAERHLAALAEYRLAELLVEEAPEEAYERWRRALDARDERVSPYAALRMATQIGSEQLVQGRIERLFHQAMGSNDLELFCEAALALACHLRSRCQFEEARRYLRMVVDTASHSERATRELECVNRAEQAARMREKLVRPRRLRARLLSELAQARSDGKRVIVVGAGTGGVYLLESLAGQRYTVCGFVDDNASEVPSYPQYRILGRIDQLADIIHNYSPEEVLLAIPTLPGSRRRAVVEACRKTNTRLLNLPRMHELGIGWTLEDSRHRLMTQLRPVEVEETIGDRRVEIDQLAASWLQYKTALVIGAGALGAEICRRLADGAVGSLVVVDRRQSALRKIQCSLSDTRGFWSFEPRYGDAGDRGYLTRVFEASAPHAVFNTVGCSWAQPREPSRVARDRGSWEMVLRSELQSAAAVTRAAIDAGVPRVIHLSSRCAGNPKDPFGAVRALVEEIVFRHGTSRPGTVQAVVRVGTLLDSRNGRLARLKQQIQTGGPVTIPKEDASARFLSTARWAELVLHAARLASDGDLLELDAGEEVGIKSIAEEAIRLRGWYPGEHVIINEVTDDRWEDPPSPGPQKAKDEALGIVELERLRATDATLEAAIAVCATSIAEHRDDLSASCESIVRESLADVTRDLSGCA